MNTIPAQEIKRRGLAAVDEIIGNGDVHVISKNQPRYVVVSEERYQELLEAQEEAQLSRVRASLKELKAGKTRRFKSAASLLAAIESEE